MAIPPSEFCHISRNWDQLRIPNSLDPDFKIYKGFCSCGESYTGEIVTNVKVHLDEHNNPTKVSNPSKHINDNVDYTFH